MLSLIIFRLRPYFCSRDVDGRLQRDSMDLESGVEEGEVTSTAATTSSTASTSEDALSSGSPRETEEMPGPGKHRERHQEPFFYFYL